MTELGPLYRAFHSGPYCSSQHGQGHNLCGFEDPHRGRISLDSLRPRLHHVVESPRPVEEEGPDLIKQVRTPCREHALSQLRIVS